MDYLIGISDDRSFVIVNLKKKVPSIYVLIFTQETVRLAKKFGINSFLFDIRTIDNTWGTIEKYTFAKDLEKLYSLSLYMIGITVKSKTFLFL